MHHQLDIDALPRNTPEPDATHARWGAAWSDPSTALRRYEWMESRFSQVVGTAALPFFAVDGDGVLIDWNPAAEQLFGWPAESVLGRPVTSTFVPGGLPSAELDEVRRLAITLSGAVMGWRLRLTARRGDGSSVGVEVHVWATVCDELVAFNAFAYEVVAASRTEHELCSMGSILQSSGEGIIGTDLEGRVLAWNDAAERIFGYTADEALGQVATLLLVPPQRAGEAYELLQRLDRGEPVVQHETVRQRKDGSLVDVAVTLSLVRNSLGDVIGLSVIVTDITERRRMADELEGTMMALASALADAREAESRTRQFLADAAHQLRTPVTGIRACAETLLRGAASRERDRLLMEMVRETSRVTRMVGSLLRMARLDQGETLSPRPCELRSLCAVECERVRRLAPSLTVELATPDGTEVEVDPDALRDILGNLLDNAARHAEGRIDVVATVDGAAVEVRVRDDGAGLAPHMVERAFERFVSLDGRGGSGLGLPIARGLARAGGGDLTYENGTFVLRLPRSPLAG